MATGRTYSLAVNPRDSEDPEKIMKKVRIGVSGAGVMGRMHVQTIVDCKSRDIALGAVCDAEDQVAERIGRKANVPHFTDNQKMFESGLIDAVIIATPHYWHAPLVIRAARAGLHVMCEKPLAATVGPARAMIRECKKHKRALGVMFHHRSRAIMIKMKQMVESGRIGEVFRAQLICSDWFRTQGYYDSNAWRGTWDGEGGGVMINQAPHHLDLFLWIAGMPRRVMGSLSTRAHKIEVEDTANFLLEYDKGKIGYIYATTAEEPGYDQFMVCGNKGTLICEGNKLRIGKLRMPITDHIFSGGRQDVIRKATGGQKTTWRKVKPPADAGGKHIMLTLAFARHILRGTPMYVDGTEALNQLELSNAMYLAGFKNKTVELPVDEDEMERLIGSLQRERSTGAGGGMRTAAMRDLRRLLRK